MFTKVIKIFLKDLKIASRDAMLLYIIVIPILLAVGISFFAPGVTDTSVKLAMLKDDSPEYIEYIESYAKVELFNSVEEIERRVLKRDDIPGVISHEDSFQIIIEGNEDPSVIQMAESLTAFYEIGATRENTTAEIISFEKTVPPLKTVLLNMLILMIVMLSGMIISLGIVEEKNDNTVSAMNVSPISQTAFIFGKSALGVIVAFASIIMSILILGYFHINWFMIITIGFTTMLLTIIVGFLQGINTDDVIEAAAGVKMMMVPIAGGIAVYELAKPQWQWTMYWNPFYWSYKANSLILSQNAQWGEIILYGAIVFVISLAIYFVTIPRIRKGISQS